jgi:hypothetical protein
LPTVVSTRIVPAPSAIERSTPSWTVCSIRYCDSVGGRSQNVAVNETVDADRGTSNWACASLSVGFCVFHPPVSAAASTVAPRSGSRSGPPVTVISTSYGSTDSAMWALS